LLIFFEPDGLKVATAGARRFRANFDGKPAILSSAGEAILLPMGNIDGAERFREEGGGALARLELWQAICCVRSSAKQGFVSKLEVQPYQFRLFLFAAYCGWRREFWKRAVS
jgi:hypothetical protein